MDNMIGPIDGSTNKQRDREDQLIDGRSMIVFDPPPKLIQHSQRLIGHFSLIATSKFETRSDRHLSNLEGMMKQH
jgi:hypothetical protein